MYMAKVVGNVVATRKDDSLVGYKLMIVKRIDVKENFIGNEEVAADYVGAGIGDYVLLCKGSAVRVEKQKVAIDMAIIGIIDTIDV
ncbi:MULTISPECIES: EutN/CcmL family microcompartment protein [Clostridium]|jgi:ethanolamine utilization protein EutN|nr:MULTISPECIES: EutN/CcmL family microcompartment protein [Clostridium]MRY42921.1 ethanolamine utilization protein EutN [Parabacteroides distasonis]ABR36165.1 Ethanolamine utilization protein EutN/carboxysome structural protein Ccml [Clostridium beijerinckii NCIMB 8052]AIU02199.1 ethanolamine utilization protein EutN/carboxysome structural protein Ccml [Clostridium beijerinckii ATCC 35702]AJH01097.1 ethanolamine utilization protein EutN [Clostridium beijerinckii]ALB48650.1 ethanolamine utiliz